MSKQGVPQNLVGIERDVPEMIRKLGFHYKDGQVVEQGAMTGRRVLVVWGASQVGKTTLAKVVFNETHHFFEGSSFLEDVRHEFEQNREISLQKKLIHELKRGGNCPEVESSPEGTKTIKALFQKKRVLIVLDDVDDKEQITKLAEELTWFGQGSAIILTSTEKSFIDVYKTQHREQNEAEVFNYHEVLPMNKNHALQLFCKHAFLQDQPPEGYKSRSRGITSAVGYLPLPIEMVGRHLNGKSDNDWRGTLNRLKSGPQGNLRPILMERWDSLRDHEPNAQDIFLDVACFFTGVEKTIPWYMWDDCRWDPLGSVGRLENMTFLRIGEGHEFLMPNQLKLLGREIVKNENPENPEERSRLWDNRDVRTILRQIQNMQGTNKVKALRVASNFDPVPAALFDHLWNLRFLELDKVDITGTCENILPNLKWLDWHGCPNKPKLFAFNMEALVILNLCSSSIQLSLQEWDQLMKKLRSLKVLNLKGCTWVNASMEIPASSLLKCLILEGCLHLELNTINSQFKNLVSFNMKGCEQVKELPEALRFMKALKELLIDGTKIKKLQFEEGSLPVLETLSACNCGELKEVDSIRFLKNLKKLFLRGCGHLKTLLPVRSTLPPVFEELGQLQEMDLSHTSIEELPLCVGHCKKLQVLRMVRTKLNAFPEAIKALEELRELDFTLCRGLKGRSCDITGLYSLRILKLKGTRISHVLARDQAQLCLHILELDDGVTTQISQNESCVS